MSAIACLIVFVVIGRKLKPLHVTVLVCSFYFFSVSVSVIVVD